VRDEHHGRDDDHHGRDDEHDHRPVRWDDDRCEDDDRPGHGPGDSGAGSDTTVVIHHLQNIQNVTYNDVDIRIDASHSIWVSGDAQAIFGDVRGDVIDNEGGVFVDGDVRAPVRVDNSVDNSRTEDSYNTDVDIRDNTVALNTGDGTLVNGSPGAEVGNVDVKDVNVALGNGDIVDDSPGAVVGNTGSTIATNGGQNGDSLDLDLDVDIDGGVAIAGDDANTGNGVENSQNDDSIVDSDNSGNLAIGQNIAQGEDAEAETELDFEVGNIVTGDHSAGDDLDQSTEIDEPLIVVLPPVYELPGEHLPVE
jgi:hypothetical protein